MGCCVGNGRKDQGWLLRRFGRRSIRQAVERRLRQLHLRSNRNLGRSWPSTMFRLYPHCRALNNLLRFLVLSLTLSPADLIFAAGGVSKTPWNSRNVRIILEGSEWS